MRQPTWQIVPDVLRLGCCEERVTDIIYLELCEGFDDVLVSKLEKLKGLHFP